MKGKLHELILRETRRNIVSELDDVRRLRGARKLAKEMLRFIPDIPWKVGYPWSIDIYNYSWNRGISLDVPYNIDELDRVAIEFQKFGWFVCGEPDKGQQTLKLTLRHPENDKWKVVLRAYAVQNDSYFQEDDPFTQSCEMVEVGTKMIETTVYEVRCKSEVDVSEGEDYPF